MRSGVKELYSSVLEMGKGKVGSEGKGEVGRKGGGGGREGEGKGREVMSLELSLSLRGDEVGGEVLKALVLCLLRGA